MKVLQKKRKHTVTRPARHLKHTAARGAHKEVHELRKTASRGARKAAGEVRELKNKAVMEGEELKNKVSEEGQELKNTAAETIENLTDPVCGMSVKKEEAIGSFNYKDKEYYFCCEECQEKFKAEPEKYEK